MIVMPLMGGLGNQLFQYSMYSYIERVLDKEPAFDLSALSRYSRKLDVLSELGLKFRTIGMNELKEHLGWPHSNRHFRKLATSQYGKIVRTSSIETEKSSSFSYTCKKLVDGRVRYLHGYWIQSHIVDAVFRDVWEGFRFPNLENHEDRLLHQDIARSNSVGLHVRRGDYLSKGASSVYGQLSIDFYRNAIRRVQSEKEDARFFLFSDDVVDAERHLGDLGVQLEVIRTNSTAPWIDMQMMSQCQHLIIANSTYSWWAAKLGNRTRRKVIAPVPWYTNGSADEHIYDQDWIRIAR